MSYFWIRISSIMGLLAVGIGAFGAHALKDIIEPNLIPVFETGSKYHFYHALALLALGLSLAAGTWPEPIRKGMIRSAILFLVGIFIFSGSLYILAITGIRWLGAITPLGGVSFILGWAQLGFLSFSRKILSSKN
jgi:uncharacterized membrane protein YgdD (TMEM256/DUF423 family)